jgi:hypothetical protein
MEASEIERTRDLRSLRRRATTRLRPFPAEVTGRTHLIIELAKDILMQGQKINKGQSGAMA